MKRIFLVIAIVCIGMITQAQDSKKIMLPTGWALSPAGKSLALGDLPLNMAVSKSKKLMAITNNGQSTQSIQLINLVSNTILDNIKIDKSWLGIAFSADEKTLYASGGNDNWILKYSIINNKLKLTDSIKLGEKWPNKISPAGICINDAKNILYVVTKDDNSLYEVNLVSKKIMNKTALPAEAYTCVLSNDNSELYISVWGAEKLLVYNTLSQKITSSITTGTHPNDLILSKNGKTIYVANGEDNSVSVIDIKNRKVLETLNCALYPNAPAGSATNGVALSTDEKTLYIANADNNCLAVFDVTTVGNSKSKGFIPVGWYPTSVRVVNKKLWVANGKGFSSKANPFGPSPVRAKEEVISHGASFKPGDQVEYIGGLFKGSMSIIPVPTDKDLVAYSKAVYKNVPYSIAKTNLADSSAPGFPIPMKQNQSSPIKYVFYVIKENRTYDQVLSDIPQGNGDTSLLLFGKNITPNQHHIAESFVLLDNFYVDAEVSADGHNWSMGGYANDYLEKTWPSSYGGRGGTYGGEGQREIANNKNGFIWNQCYRNGVSYRSYGEFVSAGRPTLSILKDHYSTKYPSYNLAITDAYRFQVWKKDFDSLLALNKVPQFNTVRFGNDHTEGLRLGRPTPYAHVADNDYAVGLFIEALAKSPIWNETAVFILEDDAQNGSDHVDAHRSTAYVAGGFVKRNFVDHTPYTTTSMLRTMELILGMPPMTQYDAAATPMWKCFDSTAKPFVFSAIAPKINTKEVNTVRNEWQQKSEKLNFVMEDSNNDNEFNKILWHGLKGNIPYPAPRRAAFVTPTEKD